MGKKKKAVEVSEAKRSATAKLTITVKPVDSNPPIITASSIEGFVDENAPIGTKVIDKNGDPIVLTVSDADLVSSISFHFNVFVFWNPFVRSKAKRVFFFFFPRNESLSSCINILCLYMYIFRNFSNDEKRSLKDIIDRLIV